MAQKVSQAFWDTFVRKFVAKIFYKKPKLVTLLVGRSNNLSERKYPT